MNRFYKPWVDDGRPWRNAVYIAEIVAALKAAYPLGAAAHIFGSIGDIAHLTADLPQDHTPYSQTGWPVPTPYPVVTATDVMHRPDLGVDCDVIFAHWLASAKAGETPWLKYLIWEGKRYDTRNNWVPVAASGHFDHIHASGRSDKTTSGLGGWNPIPGGNMPDNKQHQQALKDAGFYTGTVDGIWGPRSQAALTAAYKSVGPQGAQGAPGPQGPAGATPKTVRIEVDAPVIE